jgi:hypothetical protein
MHFCQQNPAADTESALQLSQTSGLHLHRDAQHCFLSFFHALMRSSKVHLHNFRRQKHFVLTILLRA